MKIAHIINPVDVPDSSDLYVAQPITFETMRSAKTFSSLSDSELEVGLYFTCYEDDLMVAPHGFTKAVMLTRSIQDVGDFNGDRVLPLLKDILDSLYDAAPDADYLIYSNVDIALMPHFYTHIKKIIESGNDAFVINRRTIDDTYTGLDDIPQMYSDLGKVHNGFDCFVFKRKAYPSYVLGDICLGINWIGTVLLWNLQVFSERFKVFADLHLTFHLGNDRTWMNADNSEYVIHNKMIAKNAYLKLEKAVEGFCDEDHWRQLK